MDYQAWTVNFSKLTATHDTGFTLQWEGRAQDPSAVHPGRFPKTLSSIEQVRLLRCGVEFIAQQSRQKKVAVTTRPTVVKSTSNRGVLSLKSRTPERV